MTRYRTRILDASKPISPSFGREVLHLVFHFWGVRTSFLSLSLLEPGLTPGSYGCPVLIPSKDWLVNSSSLTNGHGNYGKPPALSGFRFGDGILLPFSIIAIPENPWIPGLSILPQACQRAGSNPGSRKDRLPGKFPSNLSCRFGWYKTKWQ